MRQGQQNRRGRGRNNNNNNRKSQNPLMRSFESSGPDVKIRGTPSHIAEKYVSLARDALSSGDPVLAENYLQHAEHYNRIILGYREQMAQQGGVDPLGNGAARTHTLAGPEGSDGDEFGEDEGDEFGVQAQPQQQPAGEGQPPQQSYAPQPRNFDHQNRYDNRQPRNDREPRYNNNRHDRGDRQDFRGDRGDRHDRNGSGENRYRDDRRQHGNGSDHRAEGGFRRRERYQDPNGAERDFGNGGLRQDAGQAPQPQAQPAAPAPERERAAPPPQAVTPEQEQPAFLRRPVRRPRREEPAEVAATPPAANEDQE
jgi:hypothetical protein